MPGWQSHARTLASLRAPLKCASEDVAASESQEERELSPASHRRCAPVRIESGKPELRSYAVSEQVQQIGVRPDGPVGGEAARFSTRHVTSIRAPETGLRLDDSDLLIPPGRDGGACVVKHAVVTTLNKVTSANKTTPIARDPCSRYCTFRAGPRS